MYFIDKAIKDEEQHIVELANLAIKSPNNRDNYEAAKAEIERIERHLTENRAVVTEFDDCAVRRLVNSISISKDM